LSVLLYDGRLWLRRYHNPLDTSSNTDNLTYSGIVDLASMSHARVLCHISVTRNGCCLFNISTYVCSPFIQYTQASVILKNTLKKTQLIIPCSFLSYANLLWWNQQQVWAGIMPTGFAILPEYFLHRRHIEVQNNTGISLCNAIFTIISIPSWMMALQLPVEECGDCLVHHAYCACLGHFSL